MWTSKRDGLLNILKKNKPLLQNGETPEKFITTELNKLSSEITEKYDSGEDREPNFTAFIVGLGDIFTELIAHLEKSYNVTYNVSAASDLIDDIKKYFDQLIAKDAHGNFSIKIPTKRASGEYIKDIATLAVTPDQKQIEKILKSTGVAFNCTFLHGAGTNRSNVASWINLLSLLLQAGCLPAAFDMPGSLGKTGLALNSIRTAKEMAIYVNKIGEFTQNRQGLQPAQLPLIQVGRSSGATQVFSAEFVLNELQMKPATDLNFLVSFSNPFTMPDQTANVYDQVRAGIIKGVVVDSLAAAENLGNDLIKRLKYVKEHRPQLLEHFGDNILFAQGDNDLDGSPRDKNSPDVVTQLTQFRDNYSPLGHIYVFADPLKLDAEKGLLKDIDPAKLEAMTEGSHYLYSNMDNVTNERRGPLPDKIHATDLPKLRDQFYEVFALKYAMLDYMIDLSPITTQEKRDRLRQQREKLTGSTESYGYLRWYINNIISNMNTSEPNEKWDFDSIVTNSEILPNRKFGLSGRIKRVYNFINDEAIRVKKIVDRE